MEQIVGLALEWDQLIRNLPYPLNFLDIVLSSNQIKENSHSEILASLLKYQSRDDRKFILLKLFLEKIEFPISELNLENPVIKNEKGRIDISIVLGDTAIVIENKINYAIDQENQIEGYIKQFIEGKVDDKEYTPDKVFVIYLTRAGGHPSPTSLGSTRIEELTKKKRYFARNYKTHVLPWLNSGASLVKNSEELLYSGILQYVDSIENLFSPKIGERFMKEKIVEFLLAGAQVVDRDEHSIRFRKITELANKIETLSGAMRALLHSELKESIEAFRNKFGNPTDLAFRAWNDWSFDITPVNWEPFKIRIIMEDSLRIGIIHESGTKLSPKKRTQLKETISNTFANFLRRYKEGKLDAYWDWELILLENQRAETDLLDFLERESKNLVDFVEKFCVDEVVTQAIEKPKHF